MPEEPRVKVQIEWGDMKHTVEGDLESVMREIIQFAAKVLPNYTLASKLTFAPDYTSMVDDLSEKVKLTPEGEGVLLKQDLSAENSISLVLLASKLANALGTRPKNSPKTSLISDPYLRYQRTSPYRNHFSRSLTALWNDCEAPHLTPDLYRWSTLE